MTCAACQARVQRTLQKQPGVVDAGVNLMRMHAVILAKIAEKAKAPIIWTASVPDGPNGPIMAEADDGQRELRREVAYALDQLWDA